MNVVTGGALRAGDGAHVLWIGLLVGLMVGVVVIHPLTMVIYWFEFHPEFTGTSTLWAFVAVRLRAGFSPSMWPMTALFAAIGAALGLSAGWTSRTLVRRARQLDAQHRELRTLRELLPICAWCRKVRNDQGYWQQIEGYLADHDIAQFSHGICPNCTMRVLAEKEGVPGV